MRNYLVLKFTIEVQTCAFPKWICTFLSWILFHSLENSIRFSFFGSKEQIAVVTVTHAINICYLFSVDNMSNWQWYKQKLHDARAKSGPCKTKTQHTRNDKAEEKAEAKHVEAIWCVCVNKSQTKNITSNFLRRVRLHGLFSFICGCFIIIFAFYLRLWFWLLLLYPFVYINIHLWMWWRWLWLCGGTYSGCAANSNCVCI